jgi:hypothetical protein
MSHPTKYAIDLWFPLVVAMIVVGTRFSFYSTPGVSGSEGLLSLLIPLLGALAGFYIAALTAVSAFQMDSLDRPMPGDSIKFLGDVAQTTNPTRREFLALQFGYLSFLSLICFVVCIAGTYLNVPFQKIYLIRIGEWAFGEFVAWIFLFLFVFLISNLISVTLFSIYYLSDRIHRYEPILKSEPRIRSTD